MDNFLDQLIEKIYIHSAAVQGAFSEIIEYGGDVNIANGLVLSLREIENLINTLNEKQDKKT